MLGDYPPQTYVVQPQDTLYGIAWRHDLDYHELARWNGIGPDLRITVGQVLVLRPVAHPRTAAKTASADVAAVPPADAPAAPPRAPATAGSSIRWIWPTAYLQPPRAVEGGGILLQGLLGQPVRAASSGRVVYVGNGIRGYGNLIIIKHGEQFLSAYAHTRELEVREGQQVGVGQVIAQMGMGPHQAPALYFEIRLNGKPVNPIPFMPGSP